MMFPASRLARRLARCGVLVATLAVPTLLAAQHTATRPVSVAVLGGVATPTGGSRDYADVGFHVGGAVEARTPLPWLTVRAEGGYQRFPETVSMLSATAGARGSFEAHTRVLSAAGSVVLSAPVRGVVRPYVLAGVGLFDTAHRTEFTSATGQSTVQTDFATREPGVQLGGGLAFAVGRLGLIAEARYQTIADEPYLTHAIPLLVGVRF